MKPEKESFDYLLVGGGLQSGLIAMALRRCRPNARFAIVERSSSLAGNHTWSFHDTDISGKAGHWLRPLLQHQWPGYTVNVGGFERRIGIAYHSVASDHFARVVSEAISTSEGRCQVISDSNVVTATADSATLDDGRVIRANCVIDNRGPTPESVDSMKQSDFPGGFQKFWGFELTLPEDWPTTEPVIMDDRLDQSDGFRFAYSLPFEPRRVLVEDTRFSNHPALDRGECFLQVDQYLRKVTGGKMGIENCQIVREESGVLPMPFCGSFPGKRQDLISGGYRGGWFHAATGYSFPLAIQFADWVARTPVDQLRKKLCEESSRQLNRARFSRFLNRLLFRLVKPQTRYQIFRRFYRVLSEDRIARFYGHRFTAFDAARIVIGIPPRGLRPVKFLKSFFGRSEAQACFSEREDGEALHSKNVSDSTERVERREPCS